MNRLLAVVVAAFISLAPNNLFAECCAVDGDYCLDRSAQECVDAGGEFRTGQQCVNNQCVPEGGCQSNSDCITPSSCQSAIGATCDPSTGSCSYPIVTNGTSCSDGDACNGTETCQSGACTAGAATSCSSAPACRSSVGATCDPSTGSCSYPIVTNGTSCSDGNACNGTETCQQGSCSIGIPVQCDDGDPCSGTERCDQTLGCVTESPLIGLERLRCQTLRLVRVVPCGASRVAGFIKIRIVVEVTQIRRFIDRLEVTNNPVARRVLIRRIGVNLSDIGKLIRQGPRPGNQICINQLNRTLTAARQTLAGI